MSYKIDEKDKKIIEILKNHAEYTVRQISKKTLLPITTVHHRIIKLKKEKIITKYTVKLDSKQIDKNFSAYVLINADLKTLKEKKKTQADVIKDIAKFDFVESVAIVSGGFDIIAFVRAKDVDEFNKFLLGKIQNIEGIEKTQSFIVIEEGK